MDPPGAGVDEPSSQLDRIGAEVGLASEVTLLEAHDPAAAKVDRRDHRER
jgi:hypothetical protein